MVLSRWTRVSSARRAMAREVKGWESVEPVREDVGVETELAWEEVVEWAERESWEQRWRREGADFEFVLPMVGTEG